LSAVHDADHSPQSPEDSLTTVVIADDDAEIRELLRFGLEQQGYRVLQAENGKMLFRLLESEPCKLITLDLGLADAEGLDLARDIRSKFNVPMIIITGRHAPLTRVAVLERGADDYITKPFHVKEVILRMRTVLERYAAALRPPHDSEGTTFAFNGFVLDTAVSELKSADGASIEATEAELELLEILVRNPLRIFSRDELWKALHGRNWSPLDRTLDSHIARLRRKIEDGDEPRTIRSVRGIGYTFTAEVQRTSGGTQLAGTNLLCHAGSLQTH
jgi:two-component system, OmpR family, response regulator